MQVIELLDDKFIDEIMGIELSCFTMPWSKTLMVDEFKRGNTYYIAVTIDDEIVGYGGIWIVMDEAHLTTIGVLEQFRGKGVAKLIVKKLIDYVVSKQVYAITLEVRRSNIAAQNLYESFGFYGVGYRKQYYADNKEDALVMWLNFNQ